ncbi:MAG TPA: acetyl-CoA carboxylase carboxyltransferase subunit alpha [Opitutaceae bacterium]|jgi:acetyl-CoA carboxylase carboxyl transferase subunit alpha
METPSYSLEFEKPLRELARQLDELRQQSVENNVDMVKEIRSIEKRIESTQREIYSNLTAWQRVLVARHPKRPYALDYIDILCRGFQEFQGDRQYNDDRALIGGTAFFDGNAVVIIAQQKGRDPKERISRNFGMPQPEGYRKALRIMKMAEKFRLPVLSFVDTPGAFPGVGSEERHVSESIAVNLREMAMLRTPTLSVVIGEGGSGGALGIGVTDRVLMFENSYYSVISPEGCAAILWKDGAAAPKAAEALKVGASDLERLGAVEEVIPEPLGGAHNDPQKAAAALKHSLQKHVAELRAMDIDRLLEARYERYRRLGTYQEAGVIRS